MIILGIDPGVLNTGFAILHSKNKACRVLASGIVKTVSSQSFELRLKTIYDKLCHIIETYQIQACAMEEIFYSRNVKVALKMGHARGVALLAAANYQLPVTEYSPREVKLSVAGNGNASKYQVQQMIIQLLKLNSTPETFDVTDAMAVAYCHSQRITSPIQ